MSHKSRSLVLSLGLSFGLSALGACSGGGGGGTPPQESPAAPPVVQRTAAEFVGEWTFESTVEASDDEGRVGNQDQFEFLIELEGDGVRIELDDGPILGVVEGATLLLTQGETLSITLELDGSDKLIGEGVFQRRSKGKGGGDDKVVEDRMSFRAERGFLAQQPGNKPAPLTPIQRVPGRSDVVALQTGTWSFSIEPVDAADRKRLEDAGGNPLFDNGSLEQDGELVTFIVRDNIREIGQRIRGEILRGFDWQPNVEGTIELSLEGQFDPAGRSFRGEYKSKRFGTGIILGTSLAAGAPAKKKKS